MSQSIRTTAARQLDPLRDRLGRRSGRPFLDHLARARVEAVCRDRGHTWRQRIYNPWITLGNFLSQALSDDHSRHDAVDRFQKMRYDRGLAAVSADTASYCQDRSRLHEAAFWDLVRQAGGPIHRRARASWFFQGASRQLKRRPKPHPLLTMPRKAARRLIRRGVILYKKQKT